jgi:hypothetical protein
VWFFMSVCVVLLVIGIGSLSGSFAKHTVCPWWQVSGSASHFGLATWHKACGVLVRLELLLSCVCVG